MKVTIIVLSFNNYEDTAECLDSLAALDYPDYTVTVVDNSSIDGSAQKLRERFPKYCFIINDANLGYAEGNNVGLRRALAEGADLVWLLNNDTVVHPESLSHLVKAAELDPDVGILGSKIYFYDEPECVHFAGGKVKRHLGRGIHLGMGSRDGGNGGPAADTGFVTGASLAVRAEMIRQIGALDPGFFLYLEDLDWCLRARRSGWKVILVPDSHVWHKVSLTSLQRRPLIIYYVCRNSLICCRKNYSLWLPVVFVSCLQCYFLNYLGRFMIEGFDRCRLEYARMGLRGITDFLRGHQGAYIEKKQGRI